MQLYELKRVLNREMNVSLPQYGINTISRDLEYHPIYPFIYLNRVMEVKATGEMQVTITLD